MLSSITVFQGCTACAGRFPHLFTSKLDCYICSNVNILVKQIRTIALSIPLLCMSSHPRQHNTDPQSWRQHECRGRTLPRGCAPGGPVRAAGRRPGAAGPPPGGRASRNDSHPGPLPDHSVSRPRQRFECTARLLHACVRMCACSLCMRACMRALQVRCGPCLRACSLGVENHHTRIV